MDYNIGITLAGVTVVARRGTRYQNTRISRRICPNHNYPWHNEANEARLITTLKTSFIPEIGKSIAHARGPPCLHGHWLISTWSLVIGPLSFLAAWSCGSYKYLRAYESPLQMCNLSPHPTYDTRISLPGCWMRRNTSLHLGNQHVITSRGGSNICISFVSHHCRLPWMLRSLQRLQNTTVQVLWYEYNVLQ